MRRKNVQVMKEFKGLSTMEKMTMNEDYATVARNFDADNYPVMTVRQLRKRYGTGLPNSAQGVQGIFKYKGATQQLIAIIGSHVYRYDNGVWTDIHSLVGLPTTSTAPIATNDVYGTLFISGEGTNLIFTTGSSPSFFRYDGTTVTSFTPGVVTGMSTVFPSYVTEHENRLFCAVENRVHCSAFRLYNDWTSVAETSVIYTDLTDGEYINGLYSGQERLLVFKPNQMYELFGVDKSDFRMVKVAEDIGIVNGKCVTNLQGVTYFMHTTGVYAFGGGRPRKISGVVQKYFDAMDIAYKNQCFLQTDGKRLFANIGNDRILVWHSEYNVWYEWNGFQSRCMYSDGHFILFGSVNNNIYGFTGITDETVVGWEYITKPMNTGILSQRLRLKRLWLTSELNGTFHVYLSIKESGNASSDWSEVQMVNSTVLNRVRTVIPTTIASNANQLRMKLLGAGQCTIHEITRESQSFPLK
jgi:hypothetical protein